MKKVKVLSLLLTAALVVTSVAASPSSADAAKKKVWLSKKKITVTVGKSKIIKIRHDGKNGGGTKKGDGSYVKKMKKAGKKIVRAKVKWTSSNKKVAKVIKKKVYVKKASARVKGISPGKATVKAVYKRNGVKAVLKCKVTVRAKKNPDSTGGVYIPVPASAITGQPGASEFVVDKPNANNLHVRVDSTGPYGNITFTTEEMDALVTSNMDIYGALEDLANKSGGDVFKMLEGGGVTYTSSGVDAGTLTYTNGTQTLTMSVKFDRSTPNTIVATFTESNGFVREVTVTTSNRNECTLVKNGQAGYKIAIDSTGINEGKYSVTYSAKTGDYIKLAKDGHNKFIFSATDKLIKMYNLGFEYMVP